MVRNFSFSKNLFSEEIFVHRDSNDNNPQTPFEFTEANMTVIGLEPILPTKPQIFTLSSSYLKLLL